jgi:Family of unknown function (DUF6416)
MPSPIVIALSPAVSVQLTPSAAADLLLQLQAALPDGNVAHVDTVRGATQVLDDDHPLWDRHSGGSGHQGLEWTLDDLSEAEAFYASVKGKTKPLFDVLIDRPGQLLDTEEIIEILPDLFQSSRSIAGALKGLQLPKEASAAGTRSTGGRETPPDMR